MQLARSSAASARVSRTQRANVPAAVPRLGAGARVQRRAPIAVPRAAQGDDFDAILNKLANKWETADNKPIVAAYGVGAIFALFTAEWLIHLPLFNFLLGFPIQLVGLLALPWLGLRYLVDGKDAGADAEAYVSAITKKLPGLEK